jgi:hypothetical protein
LILFHYIPWKRKLIDCDWWLEKSWRVLEKKSKYFLLFSYFICHTSQWTMMRFQFYADISLHIALWSNIFIFTSTNSTHWDTHSVQQQLIAKMTKKFYSFFLLVLPRETINDSKHKNNEKITCPVPFFHITELLFSYLNLIRKQFSISVFNPIWFLSFFLIFLFFFFVNFGKEI